MSGAAGVIQKEKTCMDLFNHTNSRPYSHAIFINELPVFDNENCFLDCITFKLLRCDIEVHFEKQYKELLKIIPQNLLDQMHPLIFPVCQRNLISMLIIFLHCLSSGCKISLLPLLIFLQFFQQKRNY